MSAIQPLNLVVDIASGRLEPATTVVTRRLSDMRGMYADAAAEAALIERDDSVVYEVFQYDVPEETGQLFVCTTVLEPGRVGDEYFMTKGHYHRVRDRAEVYYGLRGEGQVVLMTEDGRCSSVELRPGVVAYVPPCYAHRTVNTGSGELVFLAVYPGDAGHDYESIERSGFSARVLEYNGSPTLVEQEPSEGSR